METPAGGSARQRFLTDHYTLPKHFRAATAGSLNSRHSFSQLSPSDLRNTARDSRQSRERFSFKLHFLIPFVLTSFVCFERSSLFVSIRGMFSSLTGCGRIVGIPYQTVGIPHDFGPVAGTNSRDYIILLTH
jgi:hypothetical protein